MHAPARAQTAAFKAFSVPETRPAKQEHMRIWCGLVQQRSRGACWAAAVDQVQQHGPRHHGQSVCVQSEAAASECD